MRRGVISLCQLVVCFVALLMLVWFGIVWLIGIVMAAPGRLICRVAKHGMDDFDDDMTAAFQWLEDRR